jgi:hypothetical protein
VYVCCVLVTLTSQLVASAVSQFVAAVYKGQVCCT